MNSNLFSDARLSQYGLGQVSSAEMLAKYRWNIALSESLYPLISVFEVVLRNQMDSALCQLFTDQWLGTDWYGWIRTPEMKRLERENQEKQAIIKAMARIVQNRNKLSHSRLVAELSFGFWIGLLRPYYHPVIWQNRKKPIRLVFPEGIAQSLSLWHQQLEKIRILRNRIAHHEFIWNKSSLGQDYETLLQLLGAMDAELYKWTMAMNRFPQVFKAGWKAYLHKGGA